MEVAYTWKKSTFENIILFKIYISLRKRKLEITNIYPIFNKGLGKYKLLKS